MRSSRGLLRFAATFGSVMIGVYALDHFEVELVYILGGYILVTFVYFETKFEKLSMDLTVLENLFEEEHPNYTTGSDSSKFRNF